MDIVSFLKLLVNGLLDSEQKYKVAKVDYVRKLMYYVY